MATSIVMPQLGYDMREGTIVRWLKEEGEDVTRGEIIAEIETDKAVVEFSPTTGGVLRRIVAGAGDIVPVGQLIAVIGDADEALPDELTAPASPAAAAEQVPATPAPAPVPTPVAESPPAVPEGEVRASPIARRLAREKGVNLANLTGSGPGGRIVEADVLAAAAVLSAPGGVLASPLARRLAREGGIDLSSLTGSGPGGRIVEADVLAASAAPGAETPAPVPAEAAPHRGGASGRAGRRPSPTLPDAPDHRPSNFGQQAGSAPFLRRLRHRHVQGHGPAAGH